MASSVVSTDESCDPQRGGLLPDGISLSRLFGAITCKRASSLHGNLDSAPVSSGKPVNGLSGSRPLVVTAAKRSAHAGHSDWPRRPRERLPERHESRWSRRKLCPPANRIRGKRHKGASSGYPAPVIRRPVAGADVGSAPVIRFQAPPPLRPRWLLLELACRLALEVLHQVGDVFGVLDHLPQRKTPAFGERSG